MILNSGVLFLLVIFIGYFAAIPKDRRFDLSKAFGFVAVETIIGIILFTAFNFILYRTVLNTVLGNLLGNLFMMILNIAIINGVILYWIIRFVVPKLKINDRTIALSNILFNGHLYISPFIR